MISKSKLSLLNPMNLLNLSRKKKRILFLTFLIITFLLCSTITYVPDSKASEIRNRFKSASEIVELVGRWPYGACQTSAVDVTRNIALIGNGYNLQVLDISTPSSLSKIGEIELEGPVQDIVISGNYAYVITLSYLKIIDISDLNNPSEVGSEYFEDDILQSVAFSSGYVYVASPYYAGLFIYDVSNPNDPAFQALYPDRINDVVIWENYGKTYAICGWWTWPDWTYGIGVIDVSNPLVPSLTGTYQTEDSYYLQGMDVSSDGYVYTCQNSDTDETCKIVVINVNNPASPEEVGSYVESERDFIAVTLSGNYAYFCDNGNGQLVIMDISTPSSPYDVGECDIPHGCHDMDISGSFVGIPYGSGFSLIDVSDPGSPSRLGNYDTPDRVYGGGNAIVASGDYVYLACKSDGLRIMDVSDPSNPFVAGTCDEISALGSLAVSGRFAYCSGGGWPRRLYIVDISSPTSPFLVTYLDFPDDDYVPMDVAVRGNYAYVSGNKWISGGTSGFLTVVDISNPLDPSIMGFYDCPFISFHKGGIALSGNYAYLALEEYPYVDVRRAGLRVIDISDPTNPTEVGYYFSGEEYTATTDSEGRYSHSVSMGLDVYGWSGTATPSKTGYVFSPSSRTYSHVDSDQIDQDYTATVAYTNILPQLARFAPRSTNISPQETSETGNLLREAQPTQPTISGVVKTEAGIGIEGVTIIFADASSGLAHDVVVRGNYAYLAGGTFRIIDISNPENPREIYYYPYYLSTHSSVALSGDYAYLGNLSIFNISNPYDPAGPWRYYGEGGAGLAVSGNYIYVPGSLSILKNLLAPEVSITNPSAWDIIHGAVSIEVLASHSSGIGRVEFYINDELRSVDNTSTYSYTWDTNSAADGPHKINAWAYSGNGTSSDSEIEVTVRNHMNLNIDSTAGGATDPATGTYSYDYGAEVAITAIPNSGYRFSGWTGDVPEGHENDSPITITMDSDKSITANFTAAPTVDGDGEGKKGGCFIATAAYGSPLHPHLDILRDLRDKYFMSIKLGRLLVECYYRYSPFVADFIAKHKALKVVVRVSLLPLVAFSYLIVHFGPFVTSAMLVFIFMIPIFSVSFSRRKRRRV